MKKLKVNTYPTEEHLKEEILRYIMLQICEKFKFDD